MKSCPDHSAFLDAVLLKIVVVESRVEAEHGQDFFVSDTGLLGSPVHYRVVVNTQIVA